MLEKVRKLIVGGGEELPVDPPFKLGSRVRDTLTGFEGYATAYVIHLYGCARIAIQPDLDKDGKMVDAEWIDIQRVEVVEAKVAEVKNPKAAVSGGPQKDPPMRSNSGTRVRF